MRPKRASAQHSAMCLNSIGLISNAGTQVRLLHQHRYDNTTNRVCLFPFSSTSHFLISISSSINPKTTFSPVSSLHAFGEIKTNSSRSFDLQLTQRRIQTGRNKPVARSLYHSFPHGYETVQLGSATATGL